MMMKPPHPTYKGNKISPIHMMILMSVRKEKKYGYEIIKDLRELVGDVWEPQTGVIYPAIKKLAEMGLLNSEYVEDKEHYFLSEDGIEWIRHALPMMNSIASFTIRFSTKIIEVCEEMGLEAYELPDISTMSKDDRLKMLMETRSMMERDLIRINEMIEKIAGENNEQHN